MGSFSDRINMWDDEVYKSRYKEANEREEIPSLSNRYSSNLYIKQMQSKATQVVVKIGSVAMGQGSVNRIIDYVSRDISAKDKEILLKDKDIEKESGGNILEIEDENGITYSLKAERRELIKVWSKDFTSKQHYENQQWKTDRLNELKAKQKELIERDVRGVITTEERERAKQIEYDIKSRKTILAGKEYNLKIRSPGDTRHMILSVGGKAKTAREYTKTTIAVREFLSNNIGSLGHRYIFVPHNDTENLHYHVIIKTSNEIDGKSLHFDKADLFALRQGFARELTGLGIERTAVTRLDKGLSLEKVYKGIERVREDDSWYKAQMSKGKTASFDAYEYRSKLLKRVTYILRRVDYLIADGLEPYEKKAGLKETKKVLKEYKKALFKITPRELEAEKEAVVLHLQKDSSFIAKKVDKISGYDRDGLAEVVAERNRSRINTARLYLEKHEKDLSRAFKNAPSKEIKRELSKLLEISISRGKSIKAIEKTRDKGIGMEMDF